MPDPILTERPLAHEGDGLPGPVQVTPSLPPATPYKPVRFRLFRAYAVTARVLISYLWLRGAKRLFGEAWYERRLERAHRRNARRVKRAILKLKGLFIKVGQAISIMSNVLPDTFRNELEGLQDRIPPRPTQDIQSRIQHELGEAPEALFAWFDVQPLASASLAQVHRASLADGRQVAVKVQHLDIEETAELDLKAIGRIISFVNRFLKVRGIEAYHEQISAMIRSELDFGQEAANLEAVAAQFIGDTDVGFPDVIREFSSQRVLTTTFVEGAKITDLTAIQAYGIDRVQLAERIVSAYCRMIFGDGIYHADPHPGNLFVQADGRLVFIDFGAVARLSPTMREGIPQLLEGVFGSNTDRIIAGMRTIGFLGPDDDREVAERVMGYVKQRFFDEIRRDSWQLADLDVDLETKLKTMSELQSLDIGVRDLTQTFRVPKDWVLLERTIGLLLGLCTYLAPTYNPFTTIRPHFEAYVLGQDQTWREYVPKLLRESARPWLSFPLDLREAVDRVNSGRIQVQVREVEDGARMLYRLGQQAIFSVLALGSGVLAYTAHTDGESTIALWATAGVAGALLFVLRAMRG